jgi:hypothetical protein
VAAALGVLLVLETAAAGQSREISVAVIGGEQGNRAASQAFMAGELSGSIERLDLTTYNSTPAEDLRFIYDVLVFGWGGDPAVDVDWETRLVPFLQLGGGIVFEDSGNVADLAPGVIGTEVNSSRNVRVVAAVAGLTDGVTNDPEGFVDWHMAFTAWDRRLQPFLRTDGLTVGLYGEIEGGRIVLTGTDQEYHGQFGGAGAQGNQYRFMLNEIRWAARVSEENGCPFGDCELDSFKCYRARRAKSAEPSEESEGQGAEEMADVSVLDRFGSRNVTLLRPYSVCNAVARDGLQMKNGEAQLLCYRTRGSNRDPRQSSTDMMPQTLEVQNEFGSQAVRLTRADLLCVPARSAEIGLARLGANPLQCYKSSGRDSISAPVILHDRFGTALARVSKPIATCSSATLAKEVIEAPGGSGLQCHRITGEKGQQELLPRDVEVVTSFGTEVLRVTRPHALCVPSSVGAGQ